MLKNLPVSLLQATQNVLEHEKVLETCISCGMVLGSCPHTDGLIEDEINQQDIPDEDNPKEELSGEKETVEINPTYKTFTSRRLH
jgi:hypothetical protein